MWSKAAAEKSIYMHIYPMRFVGYIRGEKGFTMDIGNSGNI